MYQLDVSLVHQADLNFLNIFINFLNLNCGTVNTTENGIKENGIKTSLNSNK